MNLNNTYKIYCVLYHPTDVVILQQGNELRQRGYDAPPNATKDITTSSSTDSEKGLDWAVHAVTQCSSDVSSRGYVRATTSFQEMKEAPYIETMSSITTNGSK